MHLDRLAELADGESARARIQRFQERAWAGFEEFVASGSTASGFLNTVTDAELDELAACFSEPDSEARLLIEELRESAVIYQSWRTQNYESNRRRVALMKRNLAGRTSRLGPDARLFLKFGNVHMGRGYSPVNQLDLGNQVAELAVLSGGDSFHVTVVGLSRVGPDGTVSDYREQAPHLGLLGSPDDESWTVVDLRPLRPLFHADDGGAEHEELARTAWRYDAAVVVPALTPARELVR